MIAPSPKGEAPNPRPKPLIPLSGSDSERVQRELVRRIVASTAFARSERLGTLLTYVCDLALKGREAEINEQKIGHEVFGRPQNYDSSADGIVRSQASRLRQRLELYFQQEGADEPIRVVVPRGGYVPIFEPKELAVSPKAVAQEMRSTPEAPPFVQEPVAKGKYGNSLQPWLQWGLSLVLAFLLVGSWIHDHRAPTPAAAAAPARHPFWSNLFKKNQSTVVVAPDSGLVLYHGLSGKDVDLKEYLNAGYRSGLSDPPRIGPTASQRNWLLDLANRRYTSMVDVEAILRLKDRARALGSEVSMRYARDLRPNDFKTGTVILLGAASADPWVELFEQNMNFVLKDDYTESYWVLNRRPQNGEPARWESVRDDPQRRVFGLVAYKSNLAGDGNALILEGTSMSGTEAAVDFVNDDTRLLPFLSQVRLADGTLSHFELLLETHNMGASAVRTQILAWRVTR